MAAIIIQVLWALVYIALAAGVLWVVFFVFGKVSGEPIPARAQTIIWIVFMLLAAIYLITIAAPALAQGETGPINLSPPSPWYVAFAEPLYILLMSVVTIVTGVVGKLAASWFGQQTASKLQESFQKAAERAAGIAMLRITQGGSGASGLPINSAIMSHAVDTGVEYMKKMMPGTIDKLGADDNAIRKAVEANIGKMVTENKK